MTLLGEQIAKAMRQTHLDVATLAALADLEPERLSAIHSGADDVLPDEVDRVARVFGVRARDFARGAALQAPLQLLLRSAFEEGRPAIDALIETAVLRELGEFQRCVLDVSELEDSLGIERRRLPTAFHASDPERAAKSLRLRLGLALAPIASMRDLLANLGVRVFFTAPDRLDRQIDGASTGSPRPAILVNLVGGSECWWRTRMTLAHELAHLLFDTRAHQTLFSPHVPSYARTRSTGRWRLFEAFDDIEVRADAFAACLLAPRDAVIEAVGALDPTSEEAIAVVGARFGVGRTVAINRLQHTFLLSLSDRLRMETREVRTSWEASFRDEIARGEVGLRRGVLPELTGEALREGKISRVRAREILGLSLRDPLPLEGIGEALRAPVISPASSARLAAQRHLAMHHPEAELTADRVERVCDRWRVSVLRGAVGAATYVAAGMLWVDDRGAVTDDPIETIAG